MFIFSENKSHDEKPQGTHQDDDHQERARWKRGSTNRSSKRPTRDGGNMYLVFLVSMQMNIDTNNKPHHVTPTTHWNKPFGAVI
jgi:hypothetical protein